MAISFCKQADRAASCSPRKLHRGQSVRRQGEAIICKEQRHPERCIYVRKAEEGGQPGELAAAEVASGAQLSALTRAQSCASRRSSRRPAAAAAAAIGGRTTGGSRLFTENARPQATNAAAVGSPARCTLKRLGASGTRRQSPPGRPHPRRGAPGLWRCPGRTPLAASKSIRCSKSHDVHWDLHRAVALP